LKTGSAAVVGRPNAGKSTLVNALVGEKVAIVSDKPQTTRGDIHAIWTTSDAQVVFTDTPGYHKPKTLLGKRLNDLVGDAVEGVEVGRGQPLVWDRTGHDEVEPVGDDDAGVVRQHSGYPGGIRSRTLQEMLDRRPEEVLRKAVKGMLPRNRLARQQIKKLKIYAGPEHPHQAQKPAPLPEHLLPAKKS